jgi:signal transduction histidine kinase
MQLPGEIHKQDNQFHISLQFGSLPEEEDRLLVLGNEELLFTAIRNIATNGCKYSDDNRAEVSLEVTEKWFIIRISDKGVGMDEKELSNIFQPFYRINDAHEAKGFGLGLSLAHRIIKLHKGNISVISTPGTGSTFTIELPVARPL